MQAVKQLSKAVIAKMKSKSSMALVLGTLMQLVFWGSLAFKELHGHDMFSFMTNLQYTIMISTVGFAILFRGLQLRRTAHKIEQQAARSTEALLEMIEATIQRAIRHSINIDSITIALLVAFVGYARLYAASAFVPDWRVLPLMGIGCLVYLVVRIITRYVERHDYYQFLKPAKSTTS
jgi:hypothetical protein